MRLFLVIAHTWEWKVGFSLGRGLLSATTMESCIQSEWRSQMSSHKFLESDIIIFGVDLKLGINMRRRYYNWFL